MTVMSTFTNHTRKVQTFTIRCNPAAGDVHTPAVGCVKLAKRPADYFGVPSFETYTSFGSVTLIHGTYAGQPVDLRYRTGQYPQSDAWATLIDGMSGSAIYTGASHGGIRRL
jgi:hypothetical protein